MRLHGIQGDAWKRYTSEGSWYYEVVEAGFKMNLPDLLAALGVAQLRKADLFLQRRREIAEAYTRHFSDMEELEMPPSHAGHAWHLFVVRIRHDLLRKNRNELIQELKQAGVGTSVHFIPLHLHPYYRDRYRYAKGDFLHAEDAYARAISLPIYPDMTDQELQRVIRSMKHLVATNLRRQATRAA
jgi:dTDP-4-amino-4,6-dideoxygalactose transaminase